MRVSFVLMVATFLKRYHVYVCVETFGSVSTAWCLSGVVCWHAWLAIFCVLGRCRFACDVGVA